MNATQHITAVPEPSTIALLLFAAWIATVVVLMSKPKRRTAGIVVLVAPLVLAMAIVPLWWFAGSFAPSPLPVSGATASIDFDPDLAPHAVVSTTASYARAEAVEVSASGIRWKTMLLLLIATLLLAGVVGVVSLLISPRTRAATLILLAIGVPAVVLLGGFVVYVVDIDRAAPMRSDAREAFVKQEAMRRSERYAQPVVAKEITTSVPSHRGVTANRALPKAGTAADKKAEKPTTAETPANDAPTKDRPTWVGKPAQMLGDTYQMTIAVGPYSTPQECEEELPRELQKALNRYVDMHVDRPAGSLPIALPGEFVREQIVKDKWEEAVPSSVGPMLRLHALMQFDRKVKDRILMEYERGVISGRLWIAGGGLAMILWALAVMYGYLRFDMKTGGIHRRRLRIAAVLAILGPVAATLWVVA